MSSILVVASWLALMGWFVWRTIYNLHFHPLARFPGPRLAAVSEWYWVYVELWKKAGMTPKLIELHAIYGDVVRIKPNELHFSNPDVYNELYSSSRRWDKDPNLYDALTVSGMHSMSTSNYYEAKKIREPIISLFSRKSVVSMQSLVQEKLDTLCSILTERHGAGKSTNLLYMFGSFTLDSITSFCFAGSADALYFPDFDCSYLRSMAHVVPLLPWFKHFPILRHLINAIPPSIGAKVSPDIAGAYLFQELLGQQVHQAINNPQTLKDASHDTVYRRFLDTSSGRTPMSAPQLRNEAEVLVFAGTDTNANTLFTGTVHVLDNAEVYRKLKMELREAWADLGDIPTYEELDKLPYLTAVIKESLRVSQAIAWPFSRIVPAEGSVLGGHAVPGKTVVGISSVFLHYNEAIFHDHRAFIPERWMEPGAESLDTYFVPFHKGPRGCLGSNLAWCQLTLAFANLFRRFDMSFDGDLHASDLKFEECFLPHWTMKDMNVVFTPVSC